MKKILFVSLIVGLFGCVSAPPKKISQEYKQQLKTICIERNTKVTIPSFETDLTRAFAEKGIRSLYFDGAVPANCSNKLNYSALRSWDMGTYVSKINLDLYDLEGNILGQVDWEQNPFALNKWKDSGKKVKYAVDQLLGNAE